MTRDVAHRENSDGVVCRADIRKSHEPANTPFCPCGTLQVTRHTGDHKVKSAVITDQRKDTSRQQRDQDQFAHAHDAVQSRYFPTYEVITTVNNTGRTSEHAAQSQHH